MTEDEIRRLVAQYVDAINSADPNEAEKFHEQASRSAVPREAQELGSQQRVQRWAARRQAFPDAKMAAENIIVDADHNYAAFEWRIRGTHSGQFMGRAPSHKQVEMVGCSVLQVAGGKIVREVSYADQMALMQQIGAMPTGAPA